MAKSPRFHITNTQCDEKDWILLTHLQQDARLSFAELGRKAGLSPPAAAERIRRLKDLGIITGYHAAVDPRRLGLAMPVLIEVEVKNADYVKFQKAVETIAWITDCHHITGRAAFLLKASAPSVEGLEMMIGHLSQFGNTSTSLVLSTVLQRRVFTQDSE